MKLDENISTLNRRFTDIFNHLKEREKCITEEEMVKKILKSLSKRWEAKTTVLSDTKDLTKFNYDLIAFLLSHEMMIDQRKITSREKKENTALKASEARKKNI